MKYCIDKLDDKLMLRCDDTLYDEPIRIRRWWPIGHWTAITYLYGARKPPEELVGEEATDYRDGSIACGGWLFFLEDGGSTKAVKVEEEPVPPPKTRCETRWSRGRWEKYLKREGWVIA